MDIATLNPFPSSPSTFSAGTFTSSNRTVVVTDARMPILSSCGPWETPPRSRGTANAVIRPFCVSVSEVVLAKTVKKSAMPPLVIQIFSPSST